MRRLGDAYLQLVSRQVRGDADARAGARNGSSGSAVALDSADDDECDVVVSGRRGADKLVHEGARDFGGVAGSDCGAKAIQAHVDRFSSTFD
jgi:hypothetical protein